MARPFPWEKSYPPGVSWDAPLPVTTLPGLLAKAAKDFGAKPALEFRGRRISYAELGNLALRAAEGFRRRGIGPGDTVALYLPNTPWHPVAFFGALIAGARVTHLSPLDAERELQFKLRDSGARVLVAIDLPGMAGLALKMLDQGNIALLCIGEDSYFGPPPAPGAVLPERPGLVLMSGLIASEPLPGFPPVGVNDIALLQYTGGTTGSPKGAMLTHANLTSAISIYDAWSLPQDDHPRGDDRVICCLPLFHIYGLTVILLRQLAHGNEIMLRMRFDVEETIADIAVKRATMFPGVPTMWIALANRPGIESVDLSSLRFGGSGGAPLPVEVASRLETLTGLQLRGGWGMTETSPAGSNLPLNGPVKSGSAGLPLPGIEIDIVAVDDPRRVLPFGETGELRIKGPNVTSGYWNRPEENAAAFADGRFLTGDIGYIDADGHVFLVDRKKDMILSGGFNVYPQMIEQAIYEHPAVGETLVIGIDDGYRGQAAKAYIALKPGAREFSLEDLRQFLSDKVGRHELPAALEFRAALPKTAVGKLHKRPLIDEERARQAATGQA